MLNFKNKPNTLLESKTVDTTGKCARTVKNILLVFVSCLMVLTSVMPTVVYAEDTVVATPVVDGDATKVPLKPVEPAKTNGDFDISLENVLQGVRQSPAKPNVNPVNIGDTTVSGKITIGYNRRNRKQKDVTVTVTVTKQGGGTEVKTVTITYDTKSQDWAVTLGSPLAVGDQVSVTQTFDGDTTSLGSETVQKKLADQHKDDLKMPAGEIWIEQTNSNQVSDDEKAEAFEMLKNANLDIANDFDSVKFSINGTEHAYYEVTYTDGSTSVKIEAPDLKIKQVTETSAGLTIEKVQVTDGQIIVTLDKEVATDTKFYFVPKFTDGEEKNFCTEGKCTAAKSTHGIKPAESVTIDGTTVTFPIKDKVNDLALGRTFGIIVKEPHKFRSCAKSEPVVTTPAKVAVRDPHKLTDADKQAIDKAIRDANTVNGKSKLPDGTGFVHDPAFIEFDKDGNVTIISPNDVEVDDWDNNGNPIYAKNPDGTYKVNDGAKVTKFPAKDLVKNIAPKSPGIAVDTDTGKVTITPPAYKNPGDDTDLASYMITYKDASGAEKTVTATRDLDTNKWSGTGVDENTGVITLSVEDIEVGGTITAKAKDNGGLIPEEPPLESDPARKTLETVEVTYDAGGGKGTMTDGKLKDGKTLNKGSKYKILDNAFTAPENEKFKTWKIGDTEYAAGVEITVKEDTTIKAIWQDIEVKVSYSPNGGSGEMTGKTMKKGSKYTLLESTFTAPDDTQEFKAWEVDGKEVAAGIEITVDKDTEVKAVWKKIKVNVTYDGNGGGGEMAGQTVDKGSKFTLPANAFTAPAKQKFKGWMIGNTVYAENAEVTINEDTVIKAVWEKLPDKPQGKPENESKGKNQSNNLGKQGSGKNSRLPAGSLLEINRNTKPLPKTGEVGVLSIQAPAILLAVGGMLALARKKKEDR